MRVARINTRSVKGDVDKVIRWNVTIHFIISFVVVCNTKNSLPLTSYALSLSVSCTVNPDSLVNYRNRP